MEAIAASRGLYAGGGIAIVGSGATEVPWYLSGIGYAVDWEPFCPIFSRNSCSVVLADASSLPILS